MTCACAIELSVQRVSAKNNLLKIRSIWRLEDWPKIQRLLQATQYNG
jgi:hypothetical protein